MPIDRVQLEQYKAGKFAELTGKMQARKLQDEDRAWLATMRTRQRQDWTKVDEDRALRIQREQETEGQRNTVFGQNQEAYQHGLKRRSGLEKQQDELTNLNLGLARTQNATAGTQTMYDPETGEPVTARIDTKTGKYERVETGGLQPYQSRRAYDLTSAEVAAWKAENFTSVGRPVENYMPLDEWVLQTRGQLGGRQTGGLKRSGIPAAKNLRFGKVISEPGPAPVKKKKTLTGLPQIYEPIGR